MEKLNVRRQDLLQTGIALLVGVLFALGLGISGMTQPQKVIGFLEIGPGWNPVLLFVMIAAIPVHMLAYIFIKKQKSPFLDVKFHLPEGSGITKSLLIGSVLFGIGWGLGGYCPGPAITSIGGGGVDAAIFVAAMLAGMLLTRFKISK